MFQMLVVLNKFHLELVNGALSLEHNQDDNYSESVLEWAHWNLEKNISKYLK